MLRRSDWILDEHLLRDRGGNRRAPDLTWQEWFASRPRKNPKEQWLFSIIELLLRNQDWAGSFVLIQTYISSCKQGEGNRFYNRTPFDESVHVRALRHWFWSLVEQYGFAMQEAEVPYAEQDIDSRRRIDRKRVENYPFVGGKPKRRYSEAVEFFEQVKADRTLHTRSQVKK